MSVNIGTTTLATSIQYSTQRKIVKTSNDELVLFALVTSGSYMSIQYQVSTDNGVTWGGWNIAYNAAAVTNFDVYLNSNDDIYIAYSRGANGLKFIVLAYSAGSWTPGSENAVSALNPGCPIRLTKRSNGDLWICTAYSANVYGYYSVDTGVNWNATSKNVSGANFFGIGLEAVGTDIWFFTARYDSGTSKYRCYVFIYTSSWDSGTAVNTDLTADQTHGISTVKYSDTDIWLSGITSGGVKVWHYTGSWDSGTLLSNHANDGSIGLMLIASNPVAYWKDYDGSNYNIAYRYYSGASWDAQVDLTSDVDIDSYPTAIYSDSLYLYIAWITGSGSPYTIYFDKVLLGVSTVQQTIDSDMKVKVLDGQQVIDSTMKIIVAQIQESILSDMEIKSAGKEYITSSMKVKVVGIQDTLDSDMKVILGKIQRNILSSMKVKIESSETIDSTMEIVASYSSKYIIGNYIYLVNDKVGSEIIKVSLLNPASYTKYSLSVSGDSIDNAKDLAINSTTNYAFVSASTGRVVKVDLDNLNLQTRYSVGETDQLKPITTVDDFDYTYIGSDTDDGELFVLDGATSSKINTDFRFIQSVYRKINTFFSFIKTSVINTDFRFLTTTNSILNTDFRFLKYTYGEETLFAREDFHIYIDAVELGNDDLKLDSINIQINVDDNNRADFILCRKHDNINSPTTITSNNVVTVYLGTKLILTGKIINYVCESNSETVHVYVETDDIVEDYSTSVKDLPLSVLDTQLSPYDILLNTITVDNPYIESDDENPPYYKGIQVNLGTEIKERGCIVISTEDFTDDIENGEMEFLPQWSYFWDVGGRNLKRIFGINNIAIGASPTDYYLSGAIERFFSGYIGTSLSSLSSDLYRITRANANRQVLFSDLETELGNYTVGSAPYKEISVKNGRKIPFRHYEDNDLGLWLVRNEKYDFENYAKKVAAKEYEKITNINGDILPRTDASIELTIDGYLFYGIKPLTRINIVNTTESGCYKDNNGFPLSVKQVNISSSSMKVSLTIDNEWSQFELDEIEAEKPEEPVETEALSTLVSIKYDLNTMQFVATAVEIL